MICLPLRNKSTSEILKQLTTHQDKADLIEIWFDEIEDLSTDNFQKILQKKTKPFLYKHQNNIENLKYALQSDFEYVDIDLDSDTKLFESVKKSPQTKLIISYHNFQATPSIEELRQIRQKMIDNNADIFKFATTAIQFQDSLNVLTFLEESVQISPCISIAMGKEGRITRAAGHLFGNYLMYAPIDQGSQTADGQILLEELKAIHNLT